MRTHEIMTKDVTCISPDTTVKDAAEKMDKLNVGFIPVCKGEEVLGIITDRDIVVRSTAHGHNPAATTVQDIMTTHIESCFDEDDIETIIQRMEELQIRRMVVVDHDKKLVGVISLGDISVRVDQNLGGEVLERVSEPSRPNRIF